MVLRPDFLSKLAVDLQKEKNKMYDSQGPLPLSPSQNCQSSPSPAYILKSPIGFLFYQSGLRTTEIHNLREHQIKKKSVGFLKQKSTILMLSNLFHV